MIHVDRNRAVGGNTIKPLDHWFATADGLKEQAILDGTDHKVTAHYKHPQVKMTLEELFGCTTNCTIAVCLEAVP